MNNLRLFLFEDCPRNCAGCCCKDYDMDNVPVVQSYKGYDMVLMTGGEPLLKPWVIYDTVTKIRKENPTTKIIVYTAMIDDRRFVKNILKAVDGMTVTLHEQEDVKAFRWLCSHLSGWDVVSKSMRLNVFKGIDPEEGVTIPDYWQIKRNMVRIKNCPLPEHEVLMRLPKQ